MNSLTQAENDERLKAICEGMSEGLNHNQIGERLGVTGTVVGRWIFSRARFLVLKTVSNEVRKSELKRRADIYLETGQRVYTFEKEGKTVLKRIGGRTCTRLRPASQWTGRTPEFCGKLTTRRTCIECEAALNYSELPAYEGQRVVKIARGARA